MLDLTHISNTRKIQNVYIYLWLLDSFLDGISNQRNRIKETAVKLTKTYHKSFTPDGMQSDLKESFKTQKTLFREIRVFFWWWHSAYTILWIGERRTLIKPKTLIRIGRIRFQKTGQFIKTPPLVKLLGDEFARAIEKHRINVNNFSKVRHDLEHILERLHAGEKNLGNLISTADQRKFQFGQKEIDISDSALDRIDLLAADVNRWLAYEPQALTTL